eukprot:CAMPEP_0195283114 /NCGR_PEP_ID=MMETSP0707-20130614/1765_1 /TAXON_ID=33640 /ORGANISM="Asterionellopsis glacialis, Strain CCMP134" /LENGTH=809 /DNA_ID=CAMNT_0040342225 /DNA_START=266 /DNA_END=2695 /DNA_ORIENTATION=+
MNTKTENHKSVLRGSDGASSATATAFSNLPLTHPIRRLYGPESAPVRRERQLLEDAIFEKRDVQDHVVPYYQHPYDRTRTLQEDTDKEDDKEDTLFQPLRIHFYTGTLESQRTVENSAKIDFIEQTILPKTAEFWSNALSVVPVEGNLKISAGELTGREYCGDSEFTTPPDDHFATGVPDTDLILYVSGTDSYRFCSGNTLAVAVACNFDQFDRPTAGAINFCLDQIEVEADGSASDETVSDNLDVAIHEAAHVLGMSSNSYRYFYNSETGEPRTQRPPSPRTVTCVDGQTRTLALPDESTMKFFTATNGQRYASLVTPKVRQVVRNQFDCQSLEGAQLENQPTGTDSCTGDHWDERMFYSEAMSGIISVTTNRLSHLTLALMEDSGWYKANFTMGHMDPFGLGAGCGFVTDSCLIPATQGQKPLLPETSRGYFCNTQGEVGCSAALTHKLACAITDYDDILPKRLPDPQFQYFDSPTLGGPRQADYCPVYSFTHSGTSDIHELACNSPKAPFSPYFEEYAEDSKCVETNQGAGCYRMACIKDEMAVKIFFRNQWHTCTHDFETIAVSTGVVDFRLTCPRLSQACPDLFCPFNCAGRGVCNYQHVVNGTVRPTCECVDPTDTSAGCSDSLIPDGEYLDNAGGLVNTYNENVLDPLISVFVDHPDRWTTAAWGYAIGLGVLFLIMIGCMCSGCLPQRKSSADVATSRPSSPESTSTTKKKKNASPKNSSSSPTVVPPSQRPSRSSPSSSSQARSTNAKAHLMAMAQEHQRQNQQIRSAHRSSSQGTSRPPPTRKTPPSTNARYNNTMYDV